MTYADTLAYLFAQLPMYQRVGQAAYKADLASTHSLMKALDHPERGFKSVHVGGTNGKGSSSHLLSSVFQAAGYKTGLYSSPHLVDFRERIRINGQMIPESEVVSFVETYKDHFEPLQLSFFEWSVGLAFHHFRKEEVDIAIIEVGMGGRLDSTNVITPELSLITNIGMDHAQFLGDSLSKIAQEKAGIIKAGIPVVVSRSQRETEGVFRKTALGVDAPITFADQQFPMDVPNCPLMGSYQKENFQGVLIALERLKKLGWKIEDQHITKGFEQVLQNTGLRGRWEILQESPKVICDVGHNVEGLERLMEQLMAESKEQLHMVLGFVNDKNIGDILDLLPKEAHLYFCEANIPRALPIDRLQQAADEKRIEHEAFKDVASAFEAAMAKSVVNDMVFVGGSTFVVADLLAYLSE